MPADVPANADLDRIVELAVLHLRTAPSAVPVGLYLDSRPGPAGPAYRISPVSASADFYDRHRHIDQSPADTAGCRVLSSAEVHAQASGHLARAGAAAEDDAVDVTAVPGVSLHRPERIDPVQT